MQLTFPLLLLWLTGAYLLGSVPFGELIAWSRGTSLRTQGSQSTGTTNTFRVLGPKMALIVLFLDVAKAAAPMLWVSQIYPLAESWQELLVGLAAVLGHCCSPFLRFKGGKAVASSLGVMLVFRPEVAGYAFVVFLVFFLLSLGRVSVGSIASVISLPVIAFLTHEQEWLAYALYTALMALIIYKHRPNIGRLLKGEEPALFKGGERHAQP